MGQLSPSGYRWRNLNPYDRLMTRVEKVTDKQGEHWMWSGSRMGLYGEYGQVTLDKVRMGAHRAMWIILRGPIPGGLDMLHQCRFTLCINPEHLRPGSHRENLAEAVALRGGKHWAPKGEACVRSKLKQFEVDDIRARYGRGERQSKLASEYGVSQPNISYIVNGQKWKG